MLLIFCTPSNLPEIKKFFTLTPFKKDVRILCASLREVFFKSLVARENEGGDSFRMLHVIIKNLK